MKRSESAGDEEKPIVSMQVQMQKLSGEIWEISPPVEDQISLIEDNEVISQLVIFSAKIGYVLIGSLGNVAVKLFKFIVEIIDDMAFKTLDDLLGNVGFAFPTFATDHDDLIGFYSHRAASTLIRSIRSFAIF